MEKHHKLLVNELSARGCDKVGSELKMRHMANLLGFTERQVRLYVYQINYEYGNNVKIASNNSGYYLVTRKKDARKMRMKQMRKLKKEIDKLEKLDQAFNINDQLSFDFTDMKTRIQNRLIEGERMEKLLTRKQLAEKLQVSDMTIHRYVKQGMPYLRVGNKLMRFDFEKVKEWLQEQNRKSS